MSDFTVFDVPFPPETKKRVIVNTDAKNEADDQYAIVHAVLTPSFDLHGIIPAHYGTRKSPKSLQESHDETVKLLRLMDLEGEVRVKDGATHAIPDESTPTPPHRTVPSHSRLREREYALCARGLFRQARAVHPAWVTRSGSS
jgi:hypothetical protein